MEAARAALAANPADLDLKFQLAEALAAVGQYADALALCLELVERDRKGIGEKARQTMVAIFQLLPPTPNWSPNISGSFRWRWQSDEFMFARNAREGADGSIRHRMPAGPRVTGGAETSTISEPLARTLITLGGGTQRAGADHQFVSQVLKRVERFGAELGVNPQLAQDRRLLAERADEVVGHEPRGDDRLGRLEAEVEVSRARAATSSDPGCRHRRR